MEAVFEPTGVSPQEQTLLVQKTPVAWHITTSLYHLVNPKVVYDAVVKLRFPAAFLNPSMVGYIYRKIMSGYWINSLFASFVQLTGNPLDLQIAARKAIDRVTRNAMITKSLPMEFLVAISPRSQVRTVLSLVTTARCLHRVSDSTGMWLQYQENFFDVLFQS